jgi:hypothetical protein
MHVPVTPLHMGPAFVAKAAVGRHFSVLVFAFSQLAMDIEPIVRFLRHDRILHGFSHTYLGATLIGLVSLFAGRFIGQYLLRRFQADPQSAFLVWLHGPNEISWTAAATGAFFGTYSHVFLDSFMHDDMEPFAPWSSANGLLLRISVDSLHLVCVGSGLFGALLLVVVFLGHRRRLIER